MLCIPNSFAPLLKKPLRYLVKQKPSPLKYCLPFRCAGRKWGLPCKLSHARDHPMRHSIPSPPPPGCCSLETHLRGTRPRFWCKAACSHLLRECLVQNTHSNSPPLRDWVFPMAAAYVNARWPNPLPNQEGGTSNRCQKPIPVPLFHSFGSLADNATLLL